MEVRLTEFLRNVLQIRPFRIFSNLAFLQCEQILAFRILEGHVYVATAPRQSIMWLGHESGHYAVVVNKFSSLDTAIVLGRLHTRIYTPLWRQEMVRRAQYVLYM